MIATTGPFAAMVASRMQLIEASVSIDLGVTAAGGVSDEHDLSRTLTGIEIDEQTTTDVPQGTRIPVGYPAASADVSIAGTLGDDFAGLSVTEAFNPFNANSPLYRKRIIGCAVDINLGLYPAGANGVPELICKFAGFVDSYDIDPVGGVVKFTCIDTRTRLRSSVDIPAVVTVAPYNAGLTAQFVIDLLLRAASNDAITSWFPKPTNAVFALGLRSSLAPEAGYLDLDDSGVNPVPQFSQGVWGMALSELSRSGSTAALPFLVPYSNDTAKLGDTAWIEAEFIYVANLNESIALQLGRPGSVVRVSFIGGANARIMLRAGTAANLASAAYSVAISPGKHYLGVAVSWPAGSGTATFTVYLDDLAAQVIQVVAPANRDALGWRNFCLVKLVENTSPGSWESIVVTSDAAVPASRNNHFVPTALLDESLNTLDAVPAQTGDPFQTIQALADAENAVAAFDPAGGTFRYMNRLTLRGGTSVRDITSLDSLVDLAMSVDMASYANRVTVPYTPWSFAPPATVWQASDLATDGGDPSAQIIAVARNSVRVMDITLDDTVMLADIDSDVSLAPAGTLAADPSTYTTSVYRASADPNGLNVHPGLTITASSPGTNTLRLTMVNQSTSDAYLVSPYTYSDVAVGSPALFIAGRLASQGEELSADVQFPPVEADGSGGAAAQPGGEVLYAAESNVWVQQEAVAFDLAWYRLRDLYSVRPNLTTVDIIPDPRLQLSDRVRLRDDGQVTEFDTYADIWNQHYSISVSDNEFTYTHSIDARASSQPGAWLLGIAGRSELAETTWL